MNWSKEQQEAFLKMKSIVQQIKEIEELAKLLPDSISTPSELQVEILKLNMENARADREFQRQMENEEREWQTQLKRLEFQNKTMKAELERAKEKQDMLAALPETIGRTIGRGITDKETSKTKQSTKQYHLEANIGESGETDCPQCHGKIYIAETEQASCAKCGLKVSVMRAGAKTQPQYEDTEV